MEEMELGKNGVQNMWLETIRSMTEREIRYKESIDKRIRGIKIRQLISIVLATLVLTTLSIIVIMAKKNLDATDSLIEVLIQSFQTMN